MSLSEETRSRIQSIVDDNQVVLFMKGNRQQPQCGFSARAVGALEELGVEYETVDVLRDPEIRSGIKAFSDWPTIPQLYIDKEFIGGSDIVQQMSRSGELHEAVGIAYVAPTKPTIHLTDTMVAALKEYGARTPGQPRLEVSPQFRYNIGFGQKAEGDFECESNGMVVLIDPSSARRADGIKLDYKPGPGGGVVIDNPSEPAGVEQLDVFQLKKMLDEGAVRLYDVRTSVEMRKASIPGAIPYTAEAIAELEDLPKDTPIAFHCHHGARSQRAAQELLQQGFTTLYNVSGGIDAWSLNIDESVPRY